MMLCLGKSAIFSIDDPGDRCRASRGRIGDGLHRNCATSLPGPAGAAAAAAGTARICLLPSNPKAFFKKFQEIEECLAGAAVLVRALGC